VLTGLDITNITDLDDALDIIRKLLNLVEALRQENLELKRQNQELRDEINRLKGEQGKPKMKPNKKPPHGQYSSEKERKKSKKRKKRRKKDRIKTHDTQICSVDKSILPNDARFKGYDRVVVQDIKFEAHNTLFLKEKYYSPSLNRTWLAPLPPGYDGEFGPAIKALAIKLYFDSNMTERNILDLFQDLAHIFANVLVDDPWAAGQVAVRALHRHGPIGAVVAAAALRQKALVRLHSAADVEQPPRFQAVTQLPERLHDTHPLEVVRSAL
jgi:hypothetical protein